MTAPTYRWCPGAQEPMKRIDQPHRCVMCTMAGRRLEHERALHRRSNNVVHALYMFAYGLVCRYPLCCVLRYSWVELVHRSQRQAILRGGLDDRPCGSFVACGIIPPGHLG